MPTRPGRRFVKARFARSYLKSNRYGRMGVGLAALRSRGRMRPGAGQPTFVETFTVPQMLTVPSNAGGVFTVRISDIPQIADYQTLYRQYRINWVKVMLLPDFASTGIDINQAYQNNAAGIVSAGLPRIAWVKNTTPAVLPPAQENDVLEDNGCKVRPLRDMWTASFRPVTDKFTGDAAGGAGVAVREKFRGFLSFAALAGNNPLHYGISYWISHQNAAPAVQTYKVYFKVSFTLRDPQ